MQTKNLDTRRMDDAILLAGEVRAVTPPNPWVGCVIVAPDGRIFTGQTQPDRGPHAEAMALGAAGDAAKGSTMYITLEPCAHVGHNPACARSIATAGVGRVVVGVLDPDPRVAGEGINFLRSQGVEVEVGARGEQVDHQLAPYLKHRRTGRPFVVLKMAMTMDGRTGAPDDTSRWITGPAARDDVHRLRAESDAIVVGAGTVRADDPALTVRGPASDKRPHRQPERVVLGTIPETASVLPALSWQADLPALLDYLGAKGHLQVLVEGGASVAASFHRAGLIDRYILYMAPAALGGTDGHPVFAGAGVATMADAWRGRTVEAVTIGNDVRITIDRGEPTCSQE